MESHQIIIEALRQKREKEENRACFKTLDNLINIFTELDHRAIPLNSFSEILKKLNRALQNEKLVLTHLKKVKNELLLALEKQYQLVVNGHYRTRWMVYGMLFGITFGPVFGTALNNNAFIGIGLPFGMAIGIALGVEKDAKAKKEGRVMDF